jgi:hypothetical protein
MNTKKFQQRLNVLTASLKQPPAWKPKRQRQWASRGIKTQKVVTLDTKEAIDTLPSSIQWKKLVTSHKIYTVLVAGTVGSRSIRPQILVLFPIIAIIGRSTSLLNDWTPSIRLCVSPAVPLYTVAIIPFGTGQ